MDNKNINNSISEDYCSFEVAKLLKGKGFDVPTTGYYRITGDRAFFGHAAFRHNNDKENETAGGMTHVAMPTHSLAVKWIRENFGLYIYLISPTPKTNWIGCIIKIGDYAPENTTDMFKSPEEATEAALRYTLENLIK